MARKGKETLLDSCTSITTLGNSIAVHVLEYLSIVKSPPNGFKELTIEFLEVSRALFTTKAGLTEAERSATKLPTDVTSELYTRFEQVRNAFIVWDQMSSKFLSNEKKASFGKLGKGFRMLFADTEIEKLRISFTQQRAALSISALMFTSTYGDVKAEAVSAIGYTALAAVLQIADPTQGQEKKTPPKLKAIALSSARQHSPPPPSPPPRGPLPAVPALDLHHARDAHLSGPWSPGLPDVSHKPSPHSMGSSKMTQAFSDRSSIIGFGGDNASDITSILSMANVPDSDAQIHNIDKLPKQAIRVKHDPSKAPKWTPKRNMGQITDASRNALAAAVQQKNHKMIEQLLDHSVPANNTEYSLLREAIINHDLESLRLLLLFGADPNAKDKDGASPLYTATGQSYFEAAQLLVKYGADANLSAGPYGETPLAITLTNDKAHFAQLFLQYGANPNTLMENGETAFTQSMNKYTPVDLVDFLLTYDAKPNTKNGRGESALFKAINAGRHDLVLRLLDHGADPNMPGPKIVLWPAVHDPQMLEALLSHGADLKRAPGVLELATSINSPKAVEILLNHGVDVNAKKDGIYTPLCSAIRDDHENLVEVLLAAGADPNLPALDYPVFKAVTYHRTHMLPRLLAAGSNPKAPKGVIEAAVAHHNTDAVLFLLKQGVDINARNSAGHTALTTAIRENDVEMIDILMKHGADPGVRGQDWPISLAVQKPQILAKLLPHIQTSRIIKGVLEMAVVADQLESIKLLLAKGVDVEEKNGGVFSPLTTSIRESRKEIFHYLIDEAGADPNAPGEHLPIIKAIRRHREDDMSYIEYLLTKGADINLMYRGWNAVLQALDNGDMKILKLLATKGNPDLNAKDELGRTVREIMQERRLEEEEEILTRGRAGEERNPSPEMKEALSSLRELVL